MFSYKKKSFVFVFFLGDFTPFWKKNCMTFRTAGTTQTRWASAVSRFTGHFLHRLSKGEMWTLCTINPLLVCNSRPKNLSTQRSLTDRGPRRLDAGDPMRRSGLCAALVSSPDARRPAGTAGSLSQGCWFQCGTRGFWMLFENRNGTPCIKITAAQSQEIRRPSGLSSVQPT